MRDLAVFRLYSDGNSGVRGSAPLVGDALERGGVWVAQLERLLDTQGGLRASVRLHAGALRVVRAGPRTLPLQAGFMDTDSCARRFAHSAWWLRTPNCPRRSSMLKSHSPLRDDARSCHSALPHQARAAGCGRQARTSVQAWCRQLFQSTSALHLS